MRSLPEFLLLPSPDFSTHTRINRVVIELIRRSVPYSSIHQALWQDGSRAPEAVLHRLLSLLDP
jgi:hypothetical protein